MGYQKMLMCMCLWTYLVSFRFTGANGIGEGGSTEKGVVIINRKAFIRSIDNDFVCAALDWWPPQKCDYGKCSWGQTSPLNLV